MTGHGGKRSGSGRPRKPEAERLIKRTVAMSREEWAEFDSFREVGHAPAERTMRGAIMELLTNHH